MDNPVDRAMRTTMYPQGAPGHVVSWALDGADIDSARPVRLTTLHSSESADRRYPTQWPPSEELWLWVGEQSSTPDIATLAPCLSQAEHDRAARFRFDEDRWSYMAAHAQLRLLLGRLLDEAPRDVAFHTLPGGKPALCPARYSARRATALQFSISHSRGLVAVALSGSPVGVDVERLRPLGDMAHLVARFMAPEALAAFNAAQDLQERIALFYRNWTLGEALVKASGEGIDQGFATLAFTQTGPARLTRTAPGRGPVERWHLGHEALFGAPHRALAA